MDSGDWDYWCLLGMLVGEGVQWHVRKWQSAQGVLRKLFYDFTVREGFEKLFWNSLQQMQRFLYFCINEDTACGPSNVEKNSYFFNTFIFSIRRTWLLWKTFQFNCSKTSDVFVPLWQVTEPFARNFWSSNIFLVCYASVLNWNLKRVVRTGYSKTYNIESSFWWVRAKNNKTSGSKASCYGNSKKKKKKYNYEIRCRGTWKRAASWTRCRNHGPGRMSLDDEIPDSHCGLLRFCRLVIFSSCS